MADPKIEVVTAVNNRKELTLLCLNSLRHANLSGMQGMAGTMLFDPHHPHSLHHRRLNMIIGSSPSHLEGYAAFVIFFVRFCSVATSKADGRWISKSALCRRFTRPGHE